MAKYLLSLDSSSFLLSEKISQDPLEHYFGKQRACGGRNEHPNLLQCVKNAPALRMQRSDPVRGNCGRKRLLSNVISTENLIDDTPLPKRRCTRTKNK